MHEPSAVAATRETVLVLPTGQRAAQATARSLARAGFRVVGGWGGGRLSGRTRYCDSLVQLPPPSSTDEFVAAARELCERERVRAVLPLSDEHQAVLVRHPEAAADGVVVGPTTGAFAHLSDKIGLLATAGRAGVATPATAVVQPGAEAVDLPPPPVYVKVVASMYDGRPAGRPLRASDPAACATLVERASRAGDTVIVQEEIDAAHWRVYFAPGAGGMLRLAARQLADHPARIAQSSVIVFDDVPPALDEANRKLLAAGAYDGAGSTQWIEHDGAWLVHDVNLRMPANVAGPIAAGLDLPRLAVAHALGRSSGAPSVRRRVNRYVWFPGELATLLAPPAARGRRSRLRIVAGLLGAALSPRGRVGPADPSDPLPIAAALASVLRDRWRAA